MGKIWNDAAVRYLEDRRVCPRCDARLAGEWCPGCGADLSGPIGGELVSTTGRVVKALRARERLINRVPTVWPAGTASPATRSAPAATAPRQTADGAGTAAEEPDRVPTVWPAGTASPATRSAPAAASPHQTPDGAGTAAEEPVPAAAAMAVGAGPVAHGPVPSGPAASGTPASEPAASGTAASGTPARPAAGPNPSSQVSVQSVLAFAGSALLAVAALVFTFFNPDLTSFAIRTSITGVITVAFLGGAWLFARRSLRFSAESVGALGVVFVLLDVWAFVQLAPAGVTGWTFAALGTLAGSAVLFTLGARSGVRVWLWAGVFGLALWPGLLGSGSTAWLAVFGSLGVAIMALILHPVLARLAARLGSSLRAERTTATTMQVVAVFVALAQTARTSLEPGPVGLLGSAGILLILAVVAALGSRYGLPRVWSFAAGSFAVGAVALLPLAVRFEDAAWYVALVPAAGGAALVALAAVRSSLAASRRAVQSGAVTVLLLCAAPALVTVITQLAGAFFAPLRWAGTVSAGGSFTVVASSDDPYTYGAGLIGQNLGLASIVALAALAATAGAVALLGRLPAAAPTATVTAPASSLNPTAPAQAAPTQTAPSDTAPSDTALSQAELSQAAAPTMPVRLALWLAVFTLLTITSWAGFSLTGQAAVGLVLAGALTGALLFVPALTAAPAAIRDATGVGAHLLLVLAAITGWMLESTAVWVGTAAVLLLAALARTVPARRRPLYLGIGYAYALVVVATALTLAGVDGIAVLCLTTTVGLLCALAATLTSWLSPRGWYAVLSVSAVPFVAGVVAVLLVRSGWTALSTGLAFALAFTLMTTRRPGLTARLRSASAALLVPSLAVVVVCLGAQLLATSGSPVVLPVIAVLVAGTFASAALIEAALARHGLTALEAATCRLAIELSAGVTGLLAVLLALVRTAAGLPTTILVLVILGTGAAVTAFTTGRRQAWWAAGASWTGALWCVWASQGVEMLEPYVLPPALALLTVGAILVARGRAGAPLAATGLALAVAPSLLALVLNGSGGFGATESGSAVPWRAYGLLAASLVLVVTGYAIARTTSGSAAAGPGVTGLQALRGLLGSIAVVASIAAAGGALQAVRWGLGLDGLPVSPQTGVMLPVLVVSAGATLLGVFAAALPRHTPTPDRPRERWRYAAATVFLAVGPISAIGPEPFSIGTLVLLMVALLGFLLVVVARARIAPVSLPPVWFLFGLAWCTAVAGWSERELRVEAFSLPLGLALLGAGIIGMRPGARPVPATVGSWPAGFAGSWRLLAPGIIVTFLPSVLATGTDPQTWRAILVMSLALVAILIGSTRRLAAPFLISLAVLPIEVIVVFTVQIGQTINPLLWWITLATIGAVLLVLAITSERKGAAAGGFSARLRDLA